MLGGLGFNKPPLPLPAWFGGQRLTTGLRGRKPIRSGSQCPGCCHTRPPSLRGELSPPVRGPRDPAVSAYSLEGVLSTGLGPPRTAGRPCHSRTGQHPVLSGASGRLDRLHSLGALCCRAPHTASCSFLLGSSQVGRRLGVPHHREHPRSASPPALPGVARVGTLVAPCSRQRLCYRRLAPTKFPLMPCSHRTLLSSHSACSGNTDSPGPAVSPAIAPTFPLSVHPRLWLAPPLLTCVPRCSGWPVSVPPAGCSSELLVRSASCC